MRTIFAIGFGLACVTDAGSAVARPVGGVFSGGRVGKGPADGVLLGVDGGLSVLTDRGTGAESAWGFGVRAGYAFADGLELHVRYDNLGINPFAPRWPLQLATGGLRYSVPFMWPMPFAEVNAGPAF